MIDIDKIEEYKENNNLKNLIILYYSNDNSKEINGAIIETIQNLGYAGRFDEVEEAFNFDDLNFFKEEIISTLLEFSSKCSSKGPLFISKKNMDVNESMQKKIDNAWIYFIDKLYFENKTLCMINCYTHMGHISDNVDLKFVDVLAKLGEFSTLKTLITERFEGKDEKFLSKVESIIKKYDKSTVVDIPLSFSSVKKSKSNNNKFQVH